MYYIWIFCWSGLIFFFFSFFSFQRMFETMFVSMNYFHIFIVFKLMLYRILLISNIKYKIHVFCIWWSAECWNSACILLVSTERFKTETNDNCFRLCQSTNLVLYVPEIKSSFWWKSIFDRALGIRIKYKYRLLVFVTSWNSYHFIFDGDENSDFSNYFHSVFNIFSRIFTGEER